MVDCAWGVGQLFPTALVALMPHRAVAILIDKRQHARDLVKLGLGLGSPYLLHLLAPLTYSAYLLHFLALRTFSTYFLDLLSHLGVVNARLSGLDRQREVLDL